MLRGVFAAIVFAGTLTGCAGASLAPTASPAGLTAVRLPMGYIPNIQYAPFYVAEASGAFRQAGLQVEFDYALETDAVTRVGAGESNFALASGEQVLLARAEQVPVVYVMAWFQDFPVAIASPAGSGLTHPSDLAGKVVGIPGLFGASYIGYRALLDAADLPEDAATLDAIGFQQVEALLTGQVDAVVVYANNEPIQLAARGMPVDLLLVADYVSLASNGVITNEATIASNPDLVRRLVQAILSGIEATLRDPDHAYETSKAFIPGLTDADAAVQRQVLEASLAYWEAQRLGLSSLESWENMQSVLLSMGLLAAEQPVADAFTNEYLP